MKKTNSAATGLMLVNTFLALFLVNGVVIYFASLLAPDKVVLGNFYITPIWAIIHSMSTLAMINAFAIPYIREFENLRGKMLTNNEWMIAYFFINFVGVWLIARLADQLGFGIASWRVAFLLAIVLDVFQGFAMMALEKSKKK